VRGAFAAGRSTQGTLTWAWGDTDVAAVGFVWNATSRLITLKFSVDGAPQEQAIRVIETTPRFGGSRRWFRCDTTDAPVRILLLPVGQTRWRGRNASRLAYQSQRQRVGGLRALLAAERRAGARSQRNAIRRLRRRERAASPQEFADAQ
jgi:hypothetical protein